MKVAETFRALVAMHPGRIDLGLGRAPGTDPLTAQVLRRGQTHSSNDEFPRQVSELLAFLHDDFPQNHPYASLIAAPLVDEVPVVFMLGTSQNGARFAADQGMDFVFGHQFNPDIAFDVLKNYRRGFQSNARNEKPYAVLGVVAFASDDPDSVLEFEAGWALSVRRMAAGNREPVSPQEVTDFAQLSAFRRSDQSDPRITTGDPATVVAQLQDLMQRGLADELVIATPALDRDRRTASYEAIAAAWLP